MPFYLTGRPFFLLCLVPHSAHFLKSVLEVIIAVLRSHLRLTAPLLHRKNKSRAQPLQTQEQLQTLQAWRALRFGELIQNCIQQISRTPRRGPLFGFYARGGLDASGFGTTDSRDSRTQLSPGRPPLQRAISRLARRAIWD